MKREIRVGISGWTYAPWRGVFFPKGLPQHKELEYASRQLNSIEINGSFYGLQRPSSYQKWYDATPENFVFSVKCSRFITHIRRLREIEAPIANFLASGVLGLREKLGPLLWQFPPSFKFDPENFEPFLKLLPHTYRDACRLARQHEDWISSRSYVPGRVMKDRPVRHAVEIRHESFCTPEFVRLMRKYDAAIVFADSSGKWPFIDEVTADFVYLRLHGKGKMYVGGYDNNSLTLWKKRIEHWTSGKNDAYVYFDNDVKVEAPFNAMTLAKMMDVSTPGVRSAA